MSTPNKTVLSLEKQCQAFKMLNTPLKCAAPNKRTAKPRLVDASLRAITAGSVACPGGWYLSLCASREPDGHQ